MNREEWRAKIRSACEEAGTYKPVFDQVIDTLAGILEIRDGAEEQYKESGCRTVVEHTNARNHTNVSKNPALVLLMDCNAQALNYWKELCLTPKAFKQTTGSLNVKVESKSLEEALLELGV